MSRQKNNEWINFVKNYALTNGISFRDALEEASTFYDQNNSTYYAPRFDYFDPYYRHFYEVGKLLGGVLTGGEETHKGALAALLSGLNASVKIE